MPSRMISEVLGEPVVAPESLARAAGPSTFVSLSRAIGPSGGTAHSYAQRSLPPMPPPSRIPRSSVPGAPPPASSVPSSHPARPGAPGPAPRSLPPRTIVDTR
jgi:hypothetical protein